MAYGRKVKDTMRGYRRVTRIGLERLLSMGHLKQAPKQFGSRTRTIYLQELDSTGLNVKKLVFFP